jgi:hypothetical protein
MDVAMDALGCATFAGTRGHFAMQKIGEQLISLPFHLAFSISFSISYDGTVT